MFPCCKSDKIPNITLFLYVATFVEYSKFSLKWVVYETKRFLHMKFEIVKHLKMGKGLTL